MTLVVVAIAILVPIILIVWLVLALCRVAADSQREGVER